MKPIGNFFDATRNSRKSLLIGNMEANTRKQDLKIISGVGKTATGDSFFFINILAPSLNYVQVSHQ